MAIFYISDYTITLGDGNKYKMLTEYDGEPEEAHGEFITVEEENYNIFVNSSNLTIKAKTEEIEKPEEKHEENTLVKVEATDNSEENVLAKEEVEKLINAIAKEDDGTVEGIDEELAKKIREKVENGETIYVEVIAKEVKAEDIEKDAKAIEEKNKDGKVATYFDITVVVKTENEELGKVTNLQNKIELTLDIPDNLPAVEKGYKRTYKVIRVHNGKVEELETTVSGKKAAFKTDAFSTYALTYKDEKVTVNPATGDNIITLVTIFVTSMLVAITTIKLNRKLRVK